MAVALSPRRRYALWYVTLSPLTIEIPYITHIDISDARPFYFPDSLISCAPLRPRATRSA